jgi:uncharacterized protein (DUF1501 family)
MMRTTRRQLLGSGALGLGGLLLGNLLPRRALGQSLEKRKFVFAYFEGGWDILLGLDPRDPGTTTPAQHQIELGYGQLGAVYQARGLQRRGQLSFGPAVPPELLAHAGDLSIVNAITMDTAAHEVGRRYFITGQFPRGLAAVGSSLPAEIAARQGDRSAIPYLSAGVEAYATGLPPHAAPLAVNSVGDLLVALTPFAQIDPDVLAAVQAYQDQGAGCEGKKLDRDGLTTSALRNQQRARDYIEAQLAAVFDLTRTDQEMVDLRTLYGIGGGSTPASPEVLAFVAGQALKREISQCASVMVTNNLDTHSNWANDHAPRQEAGWRALAALITDLKNTPSTSQPGRSMFDETTILAFSEFGRTPMFNNLQGRDHFLGNSALVAGAGIRKGVTVGRSAAVGMMPLDTDLMTGQGVERPTAEQRESGQVMIMSPKNVLATVLASAGLDYSYLRTQPIRALLP